MKRMQLIFVIVCIGILLLLLFQKHSNSVKQITLVPTPTLDPTPSTPLGILTMSKQIYPGSKIIIEKQLADASNYHQYIASYKSETLKIYALLTIPIEDKPKNGWPVIIFNHGYIPPQQYKTTERYVAYVDFFARNGYIVFKSDYRGNGLSEGLPEGAYYSPAYTIDVLNAVASMQQFPDADPKRIGMWGHSMGGNIALRSIVVKPNEIKAAVIWGGVVGSYNDLINNWHRRVSYQPGPTEIALRNRYRSSLIQQFGTPTDNPRFWNSIDPSAHIENISAPIQLHHGESDEEVPLEFSKSLFDDLKSQNKYVELYTYAQNEHNISQGFSLAMARSLQFFNTYLKGGDMYEK